MRVRFLTSVGTATGSYMEGQTLTLPDPLPEPFRGWLRQGLVAAVRDVETGTALTGREVEQAVTRRQGRRRKGSASGAGVATDGAP